MAISRESVNNMLHVFMERSLTPFGLLKAYPADALTGFHNHLSDGEASIPDKMRSAAISRLARWTCMHMLAYACVARTASVYHSFWTPDVCTFAVCGAKARHIHLPRLVWNDNLILYAVCHHLPGHCERDRVSMLCELFASLVRSDFCRRQINECNERARYYSMGLRGGKLRTCVLFPACMPHERHRNMLKDILSNT